MTCDDIVRRWLVTPDLAQRLVVMIREFEKITGHRLQIISGHRSCAEQYRLRREGRPAAPCELSTHVICPAEGADLRIPGVFPTSHIKQEFGAAAILAGLRWGGGSEEDDRGIPSDWNHVDTGPRDDSVARDYRDRWLK